MKNLKLKKAAMTAVLYYIQSEDEYAAHIGEPADPSIGTPSRDSLWRYGGRQEEIVQSSMIQMKSFPGLKR